MTATRWLVVVGSSLNVGFAVFAFAVGSHLAGWVIFGMTAAWLAWAFSGDRG